LEPEPVEESVAVEKRIRTAFAFAVEIEILVAFAFAFEITAAWAVRWAR
jgi:hypothetical protein